MHPEGDIVWQVDEEELHDMEHEQVRPAEERGVQFACHLATTLVQNSKLSFLPPGHGGLNPPLQEFRSHQGKQSSFQSRLTPVGAGA